MKRKPNNKRYDFISNRLNKYSIRKFTVGTTSILIGSLMFLGNSADAAETTTTTTDTTATPSTDSPTTEAPTIEAVTTEAPTTEAPTIEAVTTEAPTTEAPTTEAPTTEVVNTPVQAQNLEFNADNTELTGIATSGQVVELHLADGTIEKTVVDTDGTFIFRSLTVASEEVVSVITVDGDVKSEAVKVTANKIVEATTEAPTTEAPTTEAATTEAPTTEAPTTEAATTEAPTTEAPTTETPVADAPITAATTAIESAVLTPDTATVDQTTAKLNTLSTPEEKKAVLTDYLVQNTGVTQDAAVAQLDTLNLDYTNLTSDELMAALLQAIATQQDATTVAATPVSLSTTSFNNMDSINLDINGPIQTLVAAGTRTLIESDAVKNGYINSATDATNAYATLSGRAWEVDSGTPSTMANGLTAVPEGTKVYMQWIDGDGAVSPIYMASTTNHLSSVDGSQVGPGFYAFDLRTPWVDSNGKEHIYHAVGDQQYKLWIQDYTTINGNVMTMFRQAGGFYPGSFVNSATAYNLGQFPLLGTNMQRTGIYMYEEQKGDYMTKPQSEWIVDTAGPLASPSVSLQAKNSVSGKVWIETGAGDYANSGTGPNDNLADPQAAGYTVVMSSLTAEGAKAYEAQVNSYPTSQRGEIAKALLIAHPEYISATVSGVTDVNGKYTLRFPTGTLNTDYIYGYVVDPSGVVQQTYSSYTTPEFRAPNSNLSFTPQTAPAQNLIVNPMWYNVNFAIVPHTDISLDVLTYDSTTNPAGPDVSKVNIDLIGSTQSPLPLKIEWTNGAGTVVKSVPITDLTQGEIDSELVFSDLATAPVDGEIFTARLYEGENVISSDSFIYKITQASTNQQDYIDTLVEPGLPEPTTIAAPLNADGITPPAKDYAPADSTTLPAWAVVNPDGTITVQPDATVPAGPVTIPVTVNYLDGSSEVIDVVVTVAPTLAATYIPTAEAITNPYGTATTPEQVIGAVTVPGYPTTGEQPVITIDDLTLLPDGTVGGNVLIPVTVTYPDKSTDQINVSVTTEMDLVAPAITIDSIKAGDITVKGTSEPDSEVTVILEDGTTIVTKTDQAGNWSVTVPTITAGETIQAISQDANYNVSDPVSATAPIVLQATTAPGTGVEGQPVPAG
ncbi:Ig-like domain-containing protein, partial [Macrococcus epidermidis]